MIEINKFSLEDLQALNNLVQARYIRSLKGGARISKKQDRWHRLGMITLLAVIRKKKEATA